MTDGRVAELVPTARGATAAAIRCDGTAVGRKGDPLVLVALDADYLATGWTKICVG